MYVTISNSLILTYKHSEKNAAKSSLKHKIGYENRTENITLAGGSFRCRDSLGPIACVYLSITTILIYIVEDHLRKPLLRMFHR